MQFSNFPRRNIEYEDDLVIVYDERGKVIYKGIDDYDPMKYENWKYDRSLKAYILQSSNETYYKICLDI